ncbi:MAG: asparagine--tRNA ligase, partial [Clostridiaceae bacterium]|nr:asparagine--tRNA ligase [Clostridiaceae bacterium]
MERTEIKTLNQSHKELEGKEVLVCGWVRSIRDTKTFGFIELNDGSYFKNLQVVYDDSLDNFTEISKLNIGSAIRVRGYVVETPQAKQPYEVRATAVEIEGASSPDYPLQKKRHSFEFLRTIAHL